MKSVLKFAPLFVLVGFITTPVLAFGYHQPVVRYYPAAPQPITPRNSFYLDADVGYSNLATPQKYLCDPYDYTCPLYSASYQTGSVAAGANVGYRFAVNPFFLLGTEFGYDYNGQSRYTGDYYTFDPFWYKIPNSLTYKVTSQDLHLLATSTVLFQNGFKVFAKGGAARVHQTVSFSDTSATEYDGVSLSSSSYDAIKPMAAFGVGFERNRFNVYLQYSHLFGVNANDFSDFIDMNTLKANKIVSVDTVKLGIGVIIPVL